MRLLGYRRDGRPIYEIAGGTNTFGITARAYRWYADGTETGSTAVANENTSYDVDVATADANLQLRYGVQESGTGTASGSATDDYQLQYKLNSGSFTDVTGSSSVVKAYPSANLTDAASTTNRLSAGTGSFIAGEIDEADGIVTDWQLTANNHSELLYSITIVKADVADNDTITFQVLRNGGVFNTYSVTPTLTVNEVPVVSADPVAGRAAGRATAGSTVIPPPDSLSDDFNRGDQDEMGSSSEGWSWEVSAGTAGNTDIVSNRARITGLGAAQRRRSSIGLSSSDHWAEADILRNGTTYADAGVLVRGNGTDQVAYGAIWRTTDAGVSLWRIASGGGPTQIGSTVTTTMDVDTIYTIRLEVEGTALRVYWNDGLIIDTTDGTITSGTRVGVWGQKNTSGYAEWDNFVADTQFVTIVTGAALGYAAGRGTAAAQSITTTGAASGFGRGNATATSAVVTSGAASGFAAGRATADASVAAPETVTGAAHGRSAGRATTAAYCIVIAGDGPDSGYVDPYPTTYEWIGGGRGYGAGRATVTGIDVVLETAAGWAIGRATADSSVTTQIDVPHITNAPTLYEPSLGPTVYPPAISNPATLYEPSIGLSLGAGHISNPATMYEPSVSLLISPPLIDATATTYVPTVSVAGATTVEPPHITNAPTLYEPTVHTTQVYVGHISNAPTLYAPEVLGAITVSPPTIANPATLYEPALSTQVYAAHISNGPILYAPSISTTFSAPVISITPVLYAPTVIAIGQVSFASQWVLLAIDTKWGSGEPEAKWRSLSVVGKWDP